ncbi:chaperonin 10-like protein [Mycena maculata]|uniref:Chaperonin 10-like protein n=1 Tax=Mycena maculata TaxID=230809 RepID=A0AAD7HZQ2_9AGAR|nr:chaperonin 10-like protein [Mycena maculata]
MAASTMKALVTAGDGSFRLQDVSVPALSSGEILVKVIAAAQNPTDWKTLLLHTRPGNILGCDFAGTVVEIGPEVPTDLRKKGERVAGLVHGGITANGAFAEYVAVDAALVIPIPDNMTFENAAQLGVACFTVCQSLYQCLGLPTPLQPTSVPEDILIWSGTSATGQYAVQFAKLAGLRVISTASLKNIEFVKALGADEVFDYADSKTAKRISAVTGGALKYAVDCISEGMTPNQVSMSLGEEGGTISTLLPYESRRLDAPVKTVFILGYSVFGKDVEFPFSFPANQEHYENAKIYAKMISEIISTGTVNPVPVHLYPQGLSSVQDGFEDMKAGKVHAEKITYRISDTPGLGK